MLSSTKFWSLSFKRKSVGGIVSADPIKACLNFFFSFGFLLGGAGFQARLSDSARLPCSLLRGAD